MIGELDFGAINTMDTADAAMAYARGGVPVFPAAGVVSGHCSCREGAACDRAAKHPLVHWRQAATTDPSQLARWWSRWPWANVAIPTGQPSGLVIIDVDPRHGGQESLDRLPERGYQLVSTLIVSTGGGGWHLLYRHPGMHIPNAAGELLGAGPTPGIDLRGDGGYVLAPPSRHMTGHRYQFHAVVEGLRGDPAMLPDWCRPPEPVSRPAAEPVHLAGGRLERYVETALRRERERVAAAVEGRRNATLLSAARAVGTLVGAGLLAESRARAVLGSAGAGVGLGEPEVTTTLDSGLRYGMARPRQLDPEAAAPAAPPHGRIHPARTVEMSASPT